LLRNNDLYVQKFLQFSRQNIFVPDIGRNLKTDFRKNIYARQSLPRSVKVEFLVESRQQTLWGSCWLNGW